jgi:PAS fold
MSAPPAPAPRETASVESRNFALEEIFYSRTDGRGVIQAANAVFQRVSVYPWEALIGAPHKVVRHPDMPSGVFHLMWSMLKAGSPFGGFVKNLAEDGSHYWVMAVVCPLEGGFVSVRIKPTGILFQQIQQIYSDLRHSEQQDGIAAEASAAALLSRLSDLGFDSYERFMAQALSQEAQSRDAALGRAQDWRLRAILTIKDGVGKIDQQAGKVVQIFKQTNQIPYNMRLQAGRLEGTDGPISVISNNHRQMTQSLANAVAHFSEMSHLGNDFLVDAEFLHGVSMVQRELLKQFALEPEIDGEDRIQELAVLRRQQDDFAIQAQKAVLEVVDRVSAFSRICNDVRRLKAGLEMTRVMCKIERSRIAERVDGLDEIVQQLGNAQKDLDLLLGQMDSAVRQIHDAAENLMHPQQKAA